MGVQLGRYYQAGRAWSQKYSGLLLWGALLLLVAGFVYWRLVRGYIPPISYVRWPPPPDWVDLLYRGRWLMRGLLILDGMALFYLEWTTQALSRFVRRVLETWRSRFIFIGVFSALLGLFIFQPGNYIVADYRSNVSAAWAVLESIKQGQPFVYWTTYVHLGGPFMQFHNSLYYYFAALIGVFIHDFFDVAEVSAYLLFIASGFTMYLYARQLTNSKLAGLLAAVAYCGSYYRFELLSLGANYPIDALLFTFWPLQFYFIERICNGSKALDRTDIALLTISVGAHLWTHSLHGAWMVGFGLLYGLARAPFSATLTTRQRLARLAGVVAAHLGGVLIGLYQLLPVLREGNFIPAQTRTEGVGLERILDQTIAAGWQGHYLGISILVFALVGILLILFLKRSQFYALVVLAALPLFLAVGPHYWPFINDILAALPLGSLVYARGSDRYLLLALGPLAALMGIAICLFPGWLEQYRSRANWVANLLAWPLERWVVILIAIVLLENVPLTLTYSYKSPDTYLNNTTGRWPIVATLAATTDKTARVYDAGEGLSPSFIYPMLTGHPSLSGHYEEAPPSFKTSEQLAQLLRADLTSGHISSATASLLYQLNIGYLVTNGVELTLPELDLMQRTDSATLWRVPSHAPIAANTQPSTANGVSVTMPIGGDVPVTVTRQVETATTVTMDFSLPERAFVQLSYSAYPYQRVLLDGQQIETTQTPLGLIGFWAEAGDHRVEILPELSPLRKITLTIGAIALMASIAFALYPRQRV